ncbi:MAG: hypothetical protein ABIA97_03405, partial [Candidatus Omnitrophota bacterium]
AVIYHERKRLDRPVKITVDAASLKQVGRENIFNIAEIFDKRIIYDQGLVIKDKYAFKRIKINQETKYY